jgi:hypothetical protein
LGFVSQQPSPGVGHARPWRSLSAVAAAIHRPHAVHRARRTSGRAPSRISYKSRKANSSQIFAGQDVGVKQVDDHLWLITFTDYDLGYFDDETCRLEPIADPFGPKVLPMSPE